MLDTRTCLSRTLVCIISYKLEDAGTSGFILIRDEHVLPCSPQLRQATPRSSVLQRCSRSSTPDKFTFNSGQSPILDMILEHLAKLSNLNIVLASASPRRSEILRNIGLRVKVIVIFIVRFVCRSH